MNEAVREYERRGGEFWSPGNLHIGSNNKQK